MNIHRSILRSTTRVERIKKRMVNMHGNTGKYDQYF